MFKIDLRYTENLSKCTKKALPIISVVLRITITKTNTSKEGKKILYYELLNT